MRLYRNLIKLGVAGLMLAATSVHAAFVPLPPGIAVLEDDNIEYVLDANGQLKTSGALVVGDRLRAVVTFTAVRDGANQEFIGLGEPGLELTGISEIEIADINVATGVITFKPSASFEATYGAGAMATLFSQNPGDFDIGCNTISIAACETAATNGAHWLTAGFGDLDDFWYASSVYPFNLASASIEAVAGAAATAKVGAANYGLSILANSTGYMFNQQFSDVAAALPGGDDSMVDIVGSGDILGGAGLSNGFFARSDFDFQLNRIPEPGTIAVFGMGLLALGFGVRRNKG